MFILGREAGVGLAQRAFGMGFSLLFIRGFSQHQEMQVVTDSIYMNHPRRGYALPFH